MNSSDVNRINDRMVQIHARCVAIHEELRQMRVVGERIAVAVEKLMPHDKAKKEETR